MANIQQFLSDAMTVQELMEHLKQFDPESKVIASGDQGDCFKVFPVEALNDIGGLQKSKMAASGIALNIKDNSNKLGEVAVINIGG